MSLKEISEREYQFALQVSEMSLYSKDLKGIANMMGKTPKETRDYYTDMVKAYNQRHYSPKQVQLTVQKKESEMKKNWQSEDGTPAWEGKTGVSIPKGVLVGIFFLIAVVASLSVAFIADNSGETTVKKEMPSDKSTSQRFDITKAEAFAEGYMFVASSNSDVYHLWNCDYVDDIKESNLIYFKTRKEAEDSGRRQCERCFFTSRHSPVNKPYTGVIISDPVGECIAPLTVETRGEEDYYIILKGTDEMSFYVNAGQTADVEVPLGDYEIYYAVGKTWYGKEYLFGPDTARYKCDDCFEFYEEDGYVNGWTLELYLQNNGNLHTEEVGAEDFPDI